MKKELLIKYSNQNEIQQYTKKDKLGQFYALISSLIIEWTKWEKKGVTTSVPGPVQEKFLELATGFIWLHHFSAEKTEKEGYLQEISDWAVLTASSFFSATMEELGADEENILTTVVEGEEETQVPVFRCDLQTGNYYILVTRLDGSLINYLPKSENEEEEYLEEIPYEVMRRVKPGSKGKYAFPVGVGTFPFFPENVKQAYKEQKEIDTLFITEGAKKAYKGYTSAALYVVGLSSISHYRDPKSKKNKPQLHHDILELIRTCKIKKVVVLWDGDCTDISTKAVELQQNIDQRPRNFFNYAKTICALIQEDIKKSIKIYFSTIKSKAIEGSPKGLDDLLLWAEKQNPSALKRVIKDLLGLEDQNKAYTRTFDITNSDARLHEFFCLHSVDTFYLKHIDKIEQREFLFSGNRYIYINATNKLKLLQPDFIKHLRWIGDDFYEEIEVPIPSKDGTELSRKKLRAIRKGTLKDLYGSDFVDFLRDKHYTDFCNMPDHFNYQFEVTRGNGKYYNKYFPFEHKALEGSYEIIKGFLEHIFGDQIEMGLDYMQLLLLKPMQKLPVLCLYSPENATGKSKFGELLSQIFVNNVIFINNDDLKSEFGLDRFADKLVAVCDETLLERKKDAERVKALSTADAPILCNPKGMSSYEIHTVVKLIFNSNNLRMVHATENDERFWIIRVPVPKKKDPHLMEKMKMEIPAFLHFLKTRKLSTKEIGRMWFDPKLIKTDALKDVVRVNEHSDVQELRIKLEEYFIDFPEEPHLRLSTKDIIEELMPGKTLNWIDEICGQRLNIKRYTNKKGKTAVARSYILKKEAQTTFGEIGLDYKTVRYPKAPQRVWVFPRENFLCEDLDYETELTQEFIEQANKEVA